ncbi:MAG TPA: DUF1501 domain-containing protein [Gemmataceae bacterium]|jgi:uncharacterized protein (DUF1501 family)|nr:DUF1501 domain-containing protein [Gemmataceae bacterium]
MLSIHVAPGHLCDGPSRRDLLTVGTLTLFGLGLPVFLQRRAAASARKTVSGFGRAHSVIVLHLQGSPSHIDLWDPKPDAPAEIRGEFKAIATKAPGMFLGEALPRLAQQAAKFALVRSVGVEPKGLTNHGAAIYMLMTGYDPDNFSPTGLAVPPSREDLPSVGSVAARYRPTDAGALGYVALCGPVKEGAVSGVGQGAGVLGGAYDPYPMYEDPTGRFQLDSFALPPDMTLGRLRARMDLRAVVAARRSLGGADFGHFYGKAVSLIGSRQAVRAFRLDDEPAPLRERYGLTKFGQSCLLARRLVEAGTRFIQVTWPAGSDTEPAPGPDGSWDTHRNNFPMLRNWRCPVFDQSASALLEDLAARGLLDTTLVLAIGEFGRSPRIGAPTTDNVGPGGRDHWPSCYTCLLAGGGVRGGQVYGASDRYGAYPQKHPVHPYDLISTLYHALGIDPATEYRDGLDRPRRLVQHGSPITGLF